MPQIYADLTSILTDQPNFVFYLMKKMNERKKIKFNVECVMFIN